MAQATWARDGGEWAGLVREASSVWRGCLWREAMERLASAGFEMLSLRRSWNRDWSAADPLGDAPEPREPEKFREHALWSHPAGILLTMSSEQAGVAALGSNGGEASVQAMEGMGRRMAECDASYQIDLGVGEEVPVPLRQNFIVKAAGDGTNILRGASDVGRGACGSLGDVLRHCAQAGQLLTLDKWGREGDVALPVEIYSDAHGAGVRSGPRRDLFAARIAADFDEFLASIPMEAAEAIMGNSSGWDSHAGEPKRLPMPRNWNRHMQAELAAAGEERPSAFDSELAKRWGAALSEGVHGGKKSLSIPRMGERLSGGSTALHAVASMAPMAFPAGEAWIKSMDAEALRSMAPLKGACGMTPAEMALSAAMAAVDYGKKPNRPAMFEALAAAGLGGGPQELASMVLEMLKKHAGIPGAQGVGALALESALAAGSIDWSSRVQGDQGHGCLAEEMESALGQHCPPWVRAVAEGVAIGGEAPRGKGACDRPRL